MHLSPRPRGEDGFALPLALSILVILALFAAATITFATHNTDRATRDSLSAGALAAADAGIDAALYRMNKALVASEVEGVLGLGTAALAETKCISISAGQLTVGDPASGWCPAGGAEEVDGPAATGQSWRTASYTYQVSTGVNIGSSSAPLIERRIVAVGTVGSVQKRVKATVHATLDSSGNLLTAFDQVGYRQCSSDTPSGSDPSANC